MEYIEDLPEIDYTKPLCGIGKKWNELSYEERNLLEGSSLEIYKLDNSKLEKLLLAGRFIEIGHELNTKIHLHTYRKILKNYDSRKKRVLLSRVGSRIHKENLEIPDKYFSEEEIRNSLGIGSLRAKNNTLH